MTTESTTTPIVNIHATLPTPRDDGGALAHMRDAQKHIAGVSDAALEIGLGDNDLLGIDGAFAPRRHDLWQDRTFSP